MLFRSKEMPLFAHASPPAERRSPSSLPKGIESVIDQLKATDVDALNPREAMNLLYDLVERIRE